MWSKLYILYTLYDSKIAPGAYFLVPIVIIGQFFSGLNSISGNAFTKLFEHKSKDPEMEEIKKIISHMKDLMEKNMSAKVEVVTVTASNESSFYFIAGCGISVLLVGLVLGVTIAVCLYPSTLDLKKSIEDKVATPLSEAAHQTAIDTSAQVADSTRIIIDETTAIRKQGEFIQKDLTHISNGLTRWTVDVDEKLELLDKRIGLISNTNTTSLHYSENNRLNRSIDERGDLISNPLVTSTRITNNFLLRDNSLINLESSSLYPRNRDPSDSYWDTLDPTF